MKEGALRLALLVTLLIEATPALAGPARLETPPLEIPAAQYAVPVPVKSYLAPRPGAKQSPLAMHRCRRGREAVRRLDLVPAAVVLTRDGVWVAGEPVMALQDGVAGDPTLAPITEALTALADATREMAHEFCGPWMPVYHTKSHNGRPTLFGAEFEGRLLVVADAEVPAATTLAVARVAHAAGYAWSVLMVRDPEPDACVARPPINTAPVWPVTLSTTELVLDAQRFPCAEGRCAADTVPWAEVQAALRSADVPNDYRHELQLTPAPETSTALLLRTVEALSRDAQGPLRPTVSVATPASAAPGAFGPGTPQSLTWQDTVPAVPLWPLLLEHGTWAPEPVKPRSRQIGSGGLGSRGSGLGGGGTAEGLGGLGTKGRGSGANGYGDDGARPDPGASWHGGPPWTTGIPTCEPATAVVSEVHSGTWQDEELARRLDDFLERSAWCYQGALQQRPFDHGLITIEYTSQAGATVTRNTLAVQDIGRCVSDELERGLERADGYGAMTLTVSFTPAP